MATQRVLAIESVDNLTDAERAFVDVSPYPPNTDLSAYVISSGAGTQRYIAPADDSVEIGSVVEDYGSWVVTRQHATSSSDLRCRKVDGTENQRRFALGLLFTQGELPLLRRGPQLQGSRGHLRSDNPEVGFLVRR